MDKTLIIKELQNSQKHIGTGYYNNAHDFTNPNLKIDFLSIAREESDIIGWLNYELDPACIPSVQYPDQQQVSETYQKYSENFN